MPKKQRKFQQPKCLHVITCLLFSCLVLVLEWQATLATPIITTAETTSTAAANRRLRNHEKPVRGVGGGEGGLRRNRVGSIEGGTSAGSSPCEHKSLSELIKTSPVILKALGAHIFNHDDDEDLRILHNSNDALLLKWQNEQNKVLASLKRTQKIHKFTTSSSSSSSSTTSSSATSTKTAEKTRQQQNKQKQQQTFSDAATNRAAMLASMNADAILITLTPETIYKGASLLKMTPNAAEHATSHSTSSGSTSSSSNNLANGSGNGGSISTSSNTNDSNNGNSANGNGSGGGGSGSGYNSGTINSSEASYLYEGQLNATVQPLSCFDENLLKMLPSDLIIFGKLITIEEQQRQQQDDLLMDIHDYTSSSSSTLSQRRQQQQPTKDVLKISINGLHRWSSQFENYIWKHLGWDDWSDFTVCSVACGKGVQQRFRRCLLDNPMVNLNMNFNNADDEDDDDVDIDVDTDVVVEVEEEEGEEDNDNESLIVDDELNEQPNTIDVGDSRSDEERSSNKVNVTDGKKKEVAKTTTPATDVNNYHQQHSNDNMLLKTDTLIKGNMLHFITTAQTEIRVENSTTEEPEVMRIFEGHFNDTFSEKMSSLSAPVAASATLTMNNEKSFNKQSLSSFPSSSSSSASLKDKKDTRKLKKQQQQLKVKRKKHKSAKLFSTMFCEGYNIEQRNCNSFECSDDINDLLKFYRKYPTNEETNTVSTQTMTMDLNTIAAASSFSSTISGSVAAAASSSSSSTINTETDGVETYNQNFNTFTTPINMGYVQNWHNSLNFTIMLTLRVKNDSCSTATIFSIRNSTHNLYLESCKDGLRLYLERDKTTEMLPIKFNLYDYHWHQVAISIQNGDFISIYVDCSWTNSFVVSKRLFSLPVTADVEIGRGFNGELQQLLILPEHQERYQCSEKRTSINEVKRYIIDTFIDDYAN